MSAVREAICVHLQGDTGTGKLMELATGVYPGTPPEGAPEHPLVTVAAHKPMKGVRSFQRIDHEEGEFLVKGVDKNSSPARVAEINRRIRARLDGAELSITGYATLAVTWSRDVEYDEPGETGENYRHEGGIYEVWAEPL